MFHKIAIKFIIPPSFLFFPVLVFAESQTCKGPLLQVAGEERSVREVEWKLNYWYDSLDVDLVDAGSKVSGRLDTKGNILIKDTKSEIKLTAVFGKNGPYFKVLSKQKDRGKLIKLMGILTCR